MDAEIISIGNELLQGRMDDTNATYISRRLLQLGVKVVWRSTCGDAQGSIEQTLRRAAERADIVLATGGLGPTVDDTTTEALAALLGAPLQNNELVETHVRRFYKLIGVPCSDNALKQALLPDGADYIMNPVGTAPCILVKHGRADMALFPGVPREMKAMLEQALEALLRGKMPGVAVSRTLRVFGIGESNLESVIPRDITTAENPSFSFLPVDFEVHLRMTARAATREECDAILEKQARRLYECIGEYIYGEGEDNSLEAVVIGMAHTAGVSIACAESLTGGMVAARLVNVPGASAVFKGGVVAYNDEAKAELLGVPREILERHGAVSEQTAAEMAVGALRKFGADMAVATTGNAGPDAQGGAPVGQVYVALARAGKDMPPQVTGRKFVRDRGAVRTLSTLLALDMMRRELAGPAGR